MAAAGLGLALLVGLTWPVDPNPQRREALEALRAAPVPVLVPAVPPAWGARAELRPDGYALTVTRPGAAPSAVEGRRDTSWALSAPDFAVRGSGAVVSGALHPPDDLEEWKTVWWRAGDVVYGYTLPARVGTGEMAQAVERLLPLETVLRESAAWPGDTPLLYLLYLPLFAGFFAWATWSLLWREAAEVVEEPA